MKLNKNQVKKFKSINKEYLVDIINKADLDIEKILGKKTLVYNGTVLSEDNWRVALVQVTAQGIKPAEYTETLEHFGIANSTIQKEKSIIKKAIETATPYKVRKPLEYGVRGSPSKELQTYIDKQKFIEQSLGRGAKYYKEERYGAPLTEEQLGLGKPESVIGDYRLIPKKGKDLSAAEKKLLRDMRK